MSLRFTRAAAACALYVVLHIAAQLSATVFEVAPGISLWYPPCGLALALLVLLGPRVAPIVFLANVAGALLTSSLPAWWSPLLFPALITAVYTLAAWFVRRTIGSNLLPGTTRHAVVFASVTLGAPAVVAYAGTGLLAALGFATPGTYWSSVLQWWVGDALGLLTVVPVAMVFGGPWLAGRTPVRPRRRRALADVLAPSLALFGCLWLTFAVEPLPRYNAFYLCFLPLVWICLRHGLPGATVATLAITMGSLVGMHATGATAELIVSFLLFELTVSVVGLGLGSVVSRRDEARQHLAASEARLDRVISGARIGMWDWHVPDGQVTYNERCADLLGRPGVPLPPVRGSWDDAIHPGDRPRVLAGLEAHLEGRAEFFEAEYRVRTADGSDRWIHTRGSVVTRNAAGAPVLVSGTHLDISGRKHAEAEARRLRQITEATTDFVLTVDRSGRILWANTALHRVLGRPAGDALEGRPLREVLAHGPAALLAGEVMPATLRWGVWHGELSIRDGAGRERPLSLVALAHGGEDERASVSFVMRDISRLKQAEAEKLETERRIQHVQRAESLGVLAGGIAHDFNNLLGAIVGNANLARLTLPADAPAQKRLGNIETAVARAAELCQQMLAYAGRAPMCLTEVDLGALIEETSQLLHVTISSRIVLRIEVANPLARVRAAAPQLQQIVMNLVLNAADAIGPREGTIVLRAANARLADGEFGAPFDAPALPAGDYVVLEVEDDGCGIEPAVLPRVFEPFFTTKFTGHGLGLAAVLGIAKSHGGTVHVESTVGEGSTFRLVLPASPAADPAATSTPRASDWRGSGLALVVDDETQVRETVVALLQSLGFSTIEAADGRSGIERFRAHARELVLVLLDVTMPRLEGEETFAAMKDIDLAVPVVLMSGFTDKLDVSRFQTLQPAGFLQKPFPRHALQTLLQSLTKEPVAG